MMKKILFGIISLLTYQITYAKIPSIAPIAYSVDIKSEQGIEYHNQLLYHGFPIEYTGMKYQYSNVLNYNIGRLVLNKDSNSYLEVNAEKQKDNIYLTTASVVLNNQPKRILDNIWITSAGFDITRFNLDSNNSVFIWNFIEYIPSKNAYKQHSDVYIHNIQSNSLGYTSLIDSDEKASVEDFLQNRKVCAIIDNGISLTNQQFNLACKETVLVSGITQSDTKTINVNIKIMPFNNSSHFQVIKSSYPFYE